MTGRANELLEELLRLPLAEKTEVALELLADLESNVSDLPLSDEWLAEIEARARRAISGESESVPWEKVRAQIEARLAQQ